MDTHTAEIVDGGFHDKQQALAIAAFLVLSNAPPDEDRVPSAEALGLQFPSGEDLYTAWQTSFADTEAPVALPDPDVEEDA